LCGVFHPQRLFACEGEAHPLLLELELLVKNTNSGAIMPLQMLVGLLPFADCQLPFAYCQLLIAYLLPVPISPIPALPAS
jgi:hypothetical protein